ncbi:MAG: hypothetical protein QN141_06760 [Armatimonadota bacterium]|nr:hypothetical protein [Armatimonadota bacterium]MDR7450444.1 hypothetical protein [Armatimonadota bacterium]MDR7466973.1 hypothetical protein [Armatimonadota bacterium]MDR7493485.1 hypothetical protein [Armatimonadota bacterium]MDR7498750.1 hypothetical protein [Armatimonadota bacterium]
MSESASRSGERRGKTESEAEQRREPDETAGPEWVLERIQQTFETRRG